MVRRSPSHYVWSKLAFDETILSKHFTPQSSKRFKTVVVHHSTVPGKGDGKANDALYRIWQTRRASAHYGVDGRFVRQLVWDRDVAWATGSWRANTTSVSIEHANETMAPHWRVSDQTMATGAKLVAYLHWVYKMGRPVRDVTVTRHFMYTRTACPGPYLGGDRWAHYVGLCQLEYDKIAARKPGVPTIPQLPAVEHYVVRSGDTLWAIARKVGTTVAKLVGVNKIKDPDLIRPGDRINLP